MRVYFEEGVSMREIKFGFCMPIFAYPGMVFFRTPCYTELDVQTSLEAVVRAERLGYDSAWIADHLFLGREGAIMECWTTLSALAGRTSKIKLGTIHLCDGFRYPSLTAKMSATLDQISNGRLIFFYDFNWRQLEFDAYGIPWFDKDTRIARMREGLELIKRMWTEDRVTFKGQYYQVQDALCTPKPVQKPYPPIWLGESKDEPMLRTIIEQASAWNSMPATLDLLKRKLEELVAACEKYGRDYGSIEKTLETQILLARTRQEVRDIFEQIEDLNQRAFDVGGSEDFLDLLREIGPGFEGYTMAKAEEEWIIGTPDEVADRVQEYVDLGITHFMLWFIDFPNAQGMQLFAEDVIPRFRSQ